jgi:thiol-disulfide isomerase/thioredoxin
MQPIPRRLLLISILLLGLVWIWLSRADPDEVTGGTIPAPQAGFLAPDFSLQTTTDETIRLADLRGKVVILNFWASWCPPCRAEMPAFQVVSDEYAGRVEVLAVNTTNQDTLSDALAFRDEIGLSLPILLDVDGSVQRLYEITSLPTTFLIAADGRINEVVVGGPMSVAGLRARVEALLEVLP